MWLINLALLQTWLSCLCLTHTLLHFACPPLLTFLTPVIFLHHKPQKSYYFYLWHLLELNSAKENFKSSGDVESLFCFKAIKTFQSLTIEQGKYDSITREIPCQNKTVHKMYHVWITFLKGIKYRCPCFINKTDQNNTCDVIKAFGLSTM